MHASAGLSPLPRNLRLLFCPSRQLTFLPRHCLGPPRSLSAREPETTFWMGTTVICLAARGASLLPIDLSSPRLSLTLSWPPDLLNPCCVLFLLFMHSTRLHIFFHTREPSTITHTLMYVIDAQSLMGCPTLALWTAPFVV